MTKRRSDRRPPLRTAQSIERASKREDVWMKAARREALEQQTRDRRVSLVVFIVEVLTSLAFAVAGHPMWALGGVATGVATEGASTLRRLRPAGVGRSSASTRD
jgi:hypothetical protein